MGRTPSSHPTESLCLQPNRSACHPKSVYSYASLHARKVRKVRLREFPAASLLRDVRGGIAASGTRREQASASAAASFHARRTPVRGAQIHSAERKKRSGGGSERAFVSGLGQRTDREKP